MRNLSLTALLVGSLLCAGGCTHKETGSPSSGQQSSAPSTAQSAGPKGTGTAAGASSQSAAAGVHGTVAERLDVPSYTYLRIKTDKGDVWAAIPTDPVKVGTEVTVIDPQPMQKFESKSLKRTFDVILFASGVQTGGAATPASPAAGGSPMPNPHEGNGATHGDVKVDVGDVKVAKASGPDAHTVAEVFEQSKSLKDKNVTVHAKVVKVTSGVLNRNWLHLRDGSGTDAAKNNDLVVTTAEDAKVGDEVTVTGVVHTDKDLGAGYVYSVLVEDAKVAH